MIADKNSFKNYMKQFILVIKYFPLKNKFAELHFENYSINSNGRFTVKLPFYKSKLGNSMSASFFRLYVIEKKLKKIGFWKIIQRFYA